MTIKSLYNNFYVLKKLQDLAHITEKTGASDYFSIDPELIQIPEFDKIIDSNLRKDKTLTNTRGSKVFGD